LLLFSALFRVFATMRSRRTQEPKGLKACLPRRLFFLAAIPLALLAASGAPAVQKKHGGQGFCYISRKFPEAPCYRHDLVPIQSDPASRLSHSPMSAGDSLESAKLFSSPLSPERWLGLGSGPTTDKWIDFYANGPGRSFLEKAIRRSAAYLGYMEEIIREEGLPAEVLALVYVESGFDMLAVSRKRAVGPWQFMKPTAGRFGLRVGRYLDERRDPELSTRAAVRYLKYLHGLFDCWTLAAASYNSGEGRVLRAVKSQRTRDFWSLELPRQTREFVPKVAAVLAILSDPERYGFDLPASQPLEYDIVEVNGPVTLSAVASVCGSSQAALEALNPALTRGMTPPGSVAFRLRVPFGAGQLRCEELSKMRYHMVSAGESLSKIASRYDVSVGAIAETNALKNPHLIRQGALLTIPPVVARATATKAGQVLASAAKIVHYTVRPGDSLWRISARFRTSVAQLARWNELGNINKLRPGQVLRIFLPEDQPG